MKANKVLAERARQLADRSPAGSADRKAYGCAAVGLSTTATVTAAQGARPELAARTGHTTERKAS